jgi:hypothetical protein
VAEEMLSIRVRDVRPQVEVGQETVQLPEIGRPLTLLWRWRSGGCLGPQAAAPMNSRQRIPRSSRPTEEPQLDRGARGGWHWIWSAISAPEPAGDCSPRAGAHRPGHPVGSGDAAPANA